MATYYVLGIEPFKMAQVWGMHSCKKSAKKQAELLEQNKHSLCCQSYAVRTQTQVKNEKLELFS